MRDNLDFNLYFLFLSILFGLLVFLLYWFTEGKYDENKHIREQAHDLCVANGFDTYIYPRGGFHDSIRDIRCMKKEYSDYMKFNRLPFTTGETIEGKNDIVYNCENKAHSFLSDEDCITCNVWRNSFEGYYDNDLLKKYKCIN